MGSFLGFILGFAGAFTAVRRALTGLPENKSEEVEAPARPAPSAMQPTVRGNGVMPDERLTDWLRAESQRLGISAAQIDITTVDGVVYLRGRETDSALMDTLVSVARSAPGARDVIDEVKRE